MTHPSLIDVLIIGGGPAGLTAALTLARQNHTATIFDSGSYRNSDVEHVHMIPTWDHRDPAEFREKARLEILNNYQGISFEDVELSHAKKISDSLFEVGDASGRVWQGRKIILASGSEEIYPDIPGYADVWKKRIYHCLYCKGYEDRGAARTGVLAIQSAAIAPMAVHIAEVTANLSSSVTIYTQGSIELAGQIQTTLGLGTNSHGDERFKVDTRIIRQLILIEENGKASGVEVTFDDGTSVVESFLVHNPLTKVKGPFAEQLGVELAPSSGAPGTGDVVANPPLHQTSVRGVFAAGDCITPYKVIPAALSSGCNAAVAASAQLLAEKFGHKALF
ncbi:hypothetical protein BJX70DRAFT_185755 [Aspergillus crustosus]